jgi:hypothetical protein
VCVRVCARVCACVRACVRVRVIRVLRVYVCMSVYGVHLYNNIICVYGVHTPVQLRYDLFNVTTIFFSNTPTDTPSAHEPA